MTDQPIAIGQYWRSTETVGVTGRPKAGSLPPAPAQSLRVLKIIDQAGEGVWLARVVHNHHGKPPRKPQHTHITREKLLQHWARVTDLTPFAPAVTP